MDNTLVLIGVFRQLTFKMNNDIVGSMTTIFVIIFYLLFFIIGASKKIFPTFSAFSDFN